MPTVLILDNLALPSPTPSIQKFSQDILKIVSATNTILRFNSIDLIADLCLRPDRMSPGMGPSRTCRILVQRI